MKLALVILGTLVALVLLVALVGWSLPVAHRASRQATFTAPEELVYATITRVDDFPKWRSNVKSVEHVAMPNGSLGFREVGANGAILFAVDEAVQPRRLVTRIADDKLPFGGKWTYELSPAAGGTKLRITEDGEVYNPIFRFVSKFIISQHATIDTYLTDLGKKLGSAAVITD